MSIQNPDVAEIIKKVADLTRDRGREPVQDQGVPGRRAHCGRTLAHGDFGARLT
jgi:hypothetical protein